MSRSAVAASVAAGLLVLSGCAQRPLNEQVSYTAAPLHTRPAQLSSANNRSLAVSRAAARTPAGAVVLSTVPIAQAQSIPEVAWGPPSAPVLFNVIDASTTTIPLSEELDVLVLPLYAFDPATGSALIIDRDATLEDVDPTTGRVLVRSETSGGTLRVLDLTKQQETARLTVDPLVAGCWLPDGSVLAFSGGSVIVWHPDDGSSTVIAKGTDLGLSTDVDKILCRGPEVAALDHNGVLVLFDPSNLSSSILSKRADPNASPAMAWLGNSLFWVEADYASHQFGLAGYDTASQTQTAEDFSQVGFGFLSTGISAWQSSTVLLVRGMLGTGFPLSEIVSDDPTDASSADQVPINLDHPPDVAILHAFPNADSTELIVVLDEASASLSDLWLVRMK